MKKKNIVAVFLAVMLIMMNGTAYAHMPEEDEMEYKMQEVERVYSIPVWLQKIRPRAEIEEMYQSIEHLVARNQTYFETVYDENGSTVYERTEEDYKEYLKEKNEAEYEDEAGSDILESHHSIDDMIIAVSSYYSIPSGVLQTRPEEEIIEMYEGIDNSVARNSVIVEFVTNSSGEVTAYERTEMEYMAFQLEQARLSEMALPNVSNSESSSWMRITTSLNALGRWNYSLSGTFEWLVNSNSAYNTKDLLTLSWLNGMYVPNSTFGYYGYNVGNNYYTSQLTNFAVPDDNKKSMNCVVTMNDSGVRTDEVFYMRVYIRKNAVQGNETATAYYGHQIKTISWSAIASLIGGTVSFAECFYVQSASLIPLYVVSGLAGYFNTLGGIGSCYNVNEASVNDTFTDDEGAFLEAYVTRLYTVCLGRDPDITGMTDWVNALYYGQAGGGDVAYGFFFSDEYLAMNKSNYLYVQDLYRVMLDRNPDATGHQAWVAALQNGYTRQQVFRGFAESDEFAIMCSSYGIEP